MGHMAKTPENTEYDAVADVRAMRRRDIELTEAKWARVEEAAAGPEDPDAGRALLLVLGLDPDGN